MRLIIHIIGDIHQPLHTSTLFNDEFPKGDMGGNLFEIVYLKKKSLKELHAFWDSTAHIYGEIKVPLTDNTYDRLQGYADEVTEEYSRDSLKSELKLKTFDDWVQEGGQKAKEQAYWNRQIDSGDTLPDEYVEQAQDLVRKQFALGGYRLADYLVGVLGAKSPAVEVSE